jgi:Flp pilus assembly protein TadD
LKVVASDYVMLEDFGDADKWFTEVVAETPNDADANYLLGRTKFNESNFPAAISSFERALVLHPKYVEAENNIGLAWRELNALDKAEAAFQTAIDWQGDAPVDAQPFLNMGTLLADQSKMEKAIPYLAKAAALSPDNPTVHEELSHVYAAQQNLAKAQSELERAIALAPNVSSLHFKLGQIYRKEGMRDRAQEEFAVCAKLSGAHSSDKTPNPLSIKNEEDQ